ncbi:branched-chain amino acid aminotransferase [Sporosarcina sp. G11-34]|uniref:branched-chain amino acid aminotransferase n=1 Tax=Sporosarcina sp. G11-34 TaxID=2849605 RepID=UPI0022A9B0DD|nr:branched-chain amino acid aminotransferase [Sporosarcina sp. G11-34]MCZ2257732.1 branched-chain amino acid aminotransferase [Sporosarcina sp. G11-34]
MIEKRLVKQTEEALHLMKEADKIELFKEEKEYAKKHGLFQDIEVLEKDSSTRFADAYIERCEKETEALILVEAPIFLDQSIEHLKKNRHEFIFVESTSFGVIGVDAISLEFDDVFETYTALLGLKIQKKFGPAIKDYFETNLTGDAGKYSVMFSMADGLWDVNFALSYADGFKEDMTLAEAFQLIYQFLFTLVEACETFE